MIENRKILITGIGGSIGSELARQLCKTNDVYGIDLDETAFFDLIEELGIQGRVGDVANERVFDKMINTWGYPTLIFHAAARKHVTPMEWNPEEAVHTNVFGTLNVFNAFPMAKVVNISSDKAVNPDNIMGWTKRGTELLTKLNGGISVRFGNVLGSQGSVLPIWQKQVDAGKPITVTDERMTRYFMTIEEACSLVITAAERGEAGEIWILKMGEPVKIIDLAKRIIQESRKDLPIKITGIRPGEKLSEVLMTDSERKTAKEEDQFFVLQ